MAYLIAATAIISRLQTFPYCISALVDKLLTDRACLTSLKIAELLLQAYRYVCTQNDPLLKP